MFYDARKPAFVFCFALTLSCAADDPAPGPVAALAGAAGAPAGGGSGGMQAAGGRGGAGAASSTEGMAGNLGLAGRAGTGGAAPVIPVPVIPVAVSEPDPPGTNLALNTLSCASNEEGGPKIIPFAVDGDPTTMWCAINGNLGYYYGVDLGNSHLLTGARMIWEFEDRVYQYRIETSVDAITWAPWIDQVANNAIGSVVHAAPAEARYVRIVWSGLQPFPVTWSCMREFEVWGFALDAGASPAAVADADAVQTPVDASDGDAASVSGPTCDLGS